jgi:hypothetical protein
LSKFGPIIKKQLDASHKARKVLYSLDDCENKQ